MVISRLLIGNYIFDVESPSGLNDSRYFEVAIINGLRITKIRNNLPSYLIKSFTNYLMDMFEINVIVANTEYNHGVFKGILKQEQIQDIISIINLTHININEIEGFDTLQYELECKNKHVKWFFKNKINNSERKKAELTIEKLQDMTDGFEWINKDMGMFQINGMSNINEFDKITAQKFNMSLIDFKQNRKNVFVYLRSNVKLNLIGKVINKKKGLIML